eukprot:c22523_g1_i1 orf=539-718(+)
MIVAAVFCSIFHFKSELKPTCYSQVHAKHPCEFSVFLVLVYFEEFCSVAILKLGFVAYI